MSISKEELSRDFKLFRCDISNLQRTADNLRRRIDRLPDDPPKHEWKVGEWFFDKEANAIYQFYRIIPSGKLESRAIEVCGVTGATWHDPQHCIPAHFIQTAESTIGEGSIVRTPDGWVGSVVERESNGKWRVWGHGKAPCHGWFTVSELTLCPPEVKE